MNEDTGKLILRIALGVLVLLHGISKLRNGSAGSTVRSRMPACRSFLKYGVYVGEVLAPLALIAGWYSRIGAWLIAVNMLFAFGLVHRRGARRAERPGRPSSSSSQYMFFFTAIALALIGPGRYAVNQK